MKALQFLSGLKTMNKNFLILLYNWGYITRKWGTINYQPWQGFTCGWRGIMLRCTVQ